MDLDLVEFDMETVVLEIMALMMGEVRNKGLSLDLAVGGSMADARSGRWTVVGDAGRLRQVLMNLIGNAIRFTDRGGISIGLSVEADGVRADIADTGVGIPGGAVLGLALSKRHMDLMGGGLDFESGPGRGTTFTVRLPRSPARRADRPGHPSEPAGLPQGPVAGPGLGLHVLLAEDNGINRKVGGTILETLGCRVDIAEDGARAVELALLKPYDCILMDVHMPNMDGLAATRAIRKWERERPGGERPKRRIVALTASVMPEDRAAALAAGMDAFLTKPILMGELARVLSNRDQDRDQNRERA